MKTRTFRVELVIVVDEWFIENKEKEVEEIYEHIDDTLNPYEVKCDGEYQSGLYTIVADIKRIA